TGLNGTLAARYTSYEVVVDGASAVLQWESSSEAHTLAYEVETRAGEDIDFESTGYLTARGAGTLYSFRLDGLRPGVTAFRIRELHVDGSFSFGPVLESRVDLSLALEFTDPYPNPVAATAEFSIGVQVGQTV